MNHTANRIIGTQLRALRLNAGLTQQQLAKRVGQRQSVISKLESGERSLRFVEVFPYASALGVSPELLFSSAELALVFYALGCRSLMDKNARQPNC